MLLFLARFRWSRSMDYGSSNFEIARVRHVLDEASGTKKSVLIFCLPRGLCTRQLMLQEALGQIGGKFSRPRRVFET